MSVITWIGGDAGTPNSWTDRLNWKGGIAPVDGDDVTIDSAISEPAIVTTTASLQSLTLSAGASLNTANFTFITQLLTNAGKITGSNATGQALGVRMFSAAGTIINSGTIDGLGAGGVGAAFRAGGTITNDASGTITGDGKGILIQNLGAGTITNAGTITSASGDGIQLALGGVVTNNASGLIQGSSSGITSGGGADALTNDGTIRATASSGIGVLFSDSGANIVDNTLTNSGTIIGAAAAVRFGAGSDLLKLLPGASFQGLVDGGTGKNTLELVAGSGAGRVVGLGSSITNFGTVQIDASAKWTLAGTGSNGLGNSTISGFTNVDTIDVTDLSFNSVSGTFANNTLVLTNAAAQQTLHIKGAFISTDFTYASDGAGGTNIVLGAGVEPLNVFDTTTKQAIAAIGHTYTGPVALLQHEYVNVSTDGLNITAATPNWFLHSGSGEDAIAASSGTNVLDGGTGSNFLTGGSGLDTFFIDDRAAAVDIWSTIVGFHAGDAVTIWGVTPNDFKFDFQDNQGATGFTGLTLNATAPGKSIAAVTFAGFSKADLASGRLSQASGTDTASGSVYTVFHANS